MEKTRAEIIEEILDEVREYGTECAECVSASEWGTGLTTHERDKERAFDKIEAMLNKFIPE